MGSQDSLKSMDNDSLNRISDISMTIREAIRRALPTPREQFFTVMIPGKVVNFDDYKVDPKDIVTPLKVQLNQAILCDDLPPQSTIQSGPTGRSVARSYSNAISKLVPSGSTVGIAEGATKSSDQQRYEKAMALLSTQVVGKNKTIVEIYTEKQTLYTNASDRKTKAFHEALKRAQEDPKNTTNDMAKEAYDLWVQENARTYRNHVQAAYMDWVITGRKEEVEYWFAFVDQDSVLARVEQSKEAMRSAVVQDEDGTAEYQTVTLEPSDWANKCLQKMRSGTNQTVSAEWYTWEINRLEKTNQMLGILETSSNADTSVTSSNPTGSSTKETAKTNLKEAMERYLKAKKEYQDSVASGVPGKGDALKPKDGQQPDEHSGTSKPKNQLDEYHQAQKHLSDAQADYDKANLASLTNENKATRNELMKSLSGEKGLAKNQMDTNDKLIKDYTAKRKALIEAGKSSGETTFNAMATELGISQAQPDPSAQPAGSDAKTLDDFFTPVTVEVSASSSSSKTDSSATTAHAEASASGLFWHASASADLSEAKDAAQKELVNSSVKVSFECMRVDIKRSWLRAELFGDPDLVPGHGVQISPGAEEIHSLIDKTAYDPKAEPPQHGIFPMYPVAFMVACNVVLEISGSASSIQTYMNNSTKSADASVGFGPFSASAHGSTTSSSTSASCKTTDSGCRIEIKAPQIIGWISQIVPKLGSPGSQPAPAK
ncbi:hypothetical protein FRC07_005112 [Ceratobasidium sp. 392]|nr:hypothetical protein FRC07_005112 [Ceratobasidium sp. 392]